MTGNPESDGHPSGIGGLQVRATDDRANRSADHEAGRKPTCSVPRPAFPSATIPSPPSPASRSNRLYTPADVADLDYERDLGPAGPLPIHARRPSHRLSRQALDHAHVRRLRHRRGNERPLQAICSTRARPVSRSPSTCPPSTATTRTRPRRSASSASAAWPSPRWPTWRCCSTACRSTRSRPP